MYEIELEPPQIDDACSCCDDRPVRLARLILKDGEVSGAYYGLYSNKHADRGVHVLLSLGPWWEGSRREECSCFYFQLWPDEENTALRFGDVASSPWGPVEVMGAPFSRDETLLHPLKQEIFELQGRIAEADPSISGFLDRARCGDASIPLERRYGLPDAVFELPEEERSARANIGDDLVSLDDRRFFVRTLLPMPLEDESCWTVAAWCEISRSAFETLHEVWNLADDYGRFSCQGRVANGCSDIDPSGYLDAEVTLGVRDPGQLPVVLSSAHDPDEARLAQPWIWTDFLQLAVSQGFL